MTQSQEKKGLSILVIGDLVVDDSWLVGEFRSPTATHVGRSHYRSLHHPGSAVKQLCGAGRVAAVLNEARLNEPHKRFASDVHVLGVWASKDTDGYLKGMFTPPNLMGSNCHRIVPPTVAKHTRVSLHNMGDVLGEQGTPHAYKQYAPTDDYYSEVISPFIPDDALLDARKSDRYFGTTRIFRLFKRIGSRLEQLGRLDWDIVPHNIDDGYPSWLPETAKAETDAMATRLAQSLGEGTKFDAVVVKDNGKGVVSTQLIRLLLEHPSLQQFALIDKPWFVQTKRWKPAFLKLLQEHVQLPLVVYHSVALGLCRDIRTWFTAYNKVSPEAITMLDEFMGMCRRPVARRMCVLLPRAFSVIARVDASDNGVESKQLLFQPAPDPNSVSMESIPGSATALFAAMIYGMLQDDDRYVSSRFLIDGSLRVSQQWTRSESKRLLNAEMLTAPQELVLSLISPNEPDSDKTKCKLGVYVPVLDKSSKVWTLRHDDLPSVAPVVGYDNIDTESMLWHESGKMCGVGKDSRGDAFLDLSRSAIELRDYVCRAPDRRRQIAGLIDAIAAFDPRSNRSVSGLLLAKPGSGKTLLVDSIARCLDMHLLSYNITNMMYFDDLLLSFDQIVTAQAENSRRRILVFIDEVNAHIENQSVYEAFLTPLEDGYYVKSGTKRFIRPCVWLFVGTDKIDAIKSDVKGSDFTSRLTLDPVTISDVPLTEQESLYIENIYVGVTMAKRLFPHMVWVHRDVISVLGAIGRNIDNESPNRTSIDVSNRELRRLIVKELHVDGTGRARWRDCKQLINAYQGKIQHDRLESNRSLLKREDYEWIRIYDYHPEHVAR